MTTIEVVFDNPGHMARGTPMIVGVEEFDPNVHDPIVPGPWRADTRRFKPLFDHEGPLRVMATRGVYVQEAIKGLKAACQDVEVQLVYDRFPRIHDENFIPHRSDDLRDYDLFLFDGLPGGLRSFAHWADRAYRPVVVFDKGYTRNHLDKEWVQVSLGGLGRLPLSPPTARVNTPSTRRLGRTIMAGKTWLLPRSKWPTLDQEQSSKGDAVLILGQVPGDAQHGLGVEAMTAWIRRQACLIRRLGLRPYLRPHPKDLHHVNLCYQAASPEALREVLGIDGWQDPDRWAAITASMGYAGAWTYNSTAGLDCLRIGVPVWCDAGAHYGRFRRLPNDSKPSWWNAALDDYWHSLAFGQWTLDELTGPDWVANLHHWMDAEAR